MSEILENDDAWSQSFIDGFLATYQQTGKTDWKRYPRPSNTPLPPSPGVDLSRASLMVITSAGFSMPGQAPFDAANALGDYAVRELSLDTDPSDFTISHEHYDHGMVRDDPGVLWPVEILRGVEGEGRIGRLIPVAAGFMGYQPDVRRVVGETAPAIVALARRLHAEAAFLVPS